MCDCPTTGVYTATTHETHHSWIIFKECKTSGAVVKAGIQASIDDEMGTETATTANPDTNLLFQSLDPHLRPVTPDPTIPQSMQIYEEHKKYAQEYWSVQEQLVYLTRRKNQLLKEKIENEERKKRIQQHQSERDSLIMAMKCLKGENETGNSSRNSGDAWVMVPRSDDSRN